MNRNAWREVLAAACLMGLTSCATPYPTLRSSNVTPSEAIAATGGTPQSHSVNGTFASALVATVTTNGGPASGLVVIFTAPASGASATFSDTTAITASATTDSNGVATSPVFAANGTAGIYAITAAVSGAVTPADFYFDKYDRSAGGDLGHCWNSSICAYQHRVSCPARCHCCGQR